MTLSCLNTGQINIVQFPPSTKKPQLCIEKVHSSRKETIKELKEKLFRIQGERLEPRLRDIKNCKLWKLDAKYSIALLQELAERNAKVELVNCRKLEDKHALEDCEISETDTVLVEFKTGAEWRFTSEKEIKQLEAFQCAACHATRKNLQFCVCLQVRSHL